MSDRQHPRERDRIQCLECGRWFRALPSHIRRSHGMTDEDYRLAHNIAVGSPLVCEEWSERAREVAVDTDLRSKGTTDGPPKGFRQRESVRQARRQHYLDLSAAGRAVAHQLDKTAERRAKLAPYPVTMVEAAKRLGCTNQAAYTFLSYCVKTGRLRRIRRGLYDEVKS